MRLLLPESRPLDAADLLDLYGGDRDKPLLRAGFVLSTDGGVVLDGGSRALQSATDQAAFHALRGVADAVLVGAGTARSEGYRPVRPRPDAQSWRAGRGLRARPPLVLVTRSLDLPAQSLADDTLVVTCAAALTSAGRPPQLTPKQLVVAGDDTVDLTAALAHLHERGHRALLCEGGPQLLTDLLHAGLVDELCLTHTPLLLGAVPGLLSAAAAPPVRLSLEHLVDGGDGVLLARYATQPAEAAQHG